LTSINTKIMRDIRYTGLFAFFIGLIFCLNLGGQVTDTLAIQDFETTPRTPVWTYSGAPTFNSGTTGSGASPASSPIGIGGSRAWETTAVSAGVTLEFANRTIPSGYDSLRITFKLAAMNLNSSSGGPDDLDYVYFQYSTDGGTNYTHRITVRGATANNSTWAYSATGIAKAYYTPTGTLTFQPATSGLQTTYGYSTCEIVFPGTVSQLRAKIIARSSSSSDTWMIDNVILTGEKNCLPNTGSDTITACNGYTSPSGRHHWSTSGLYYDTLQNSSGCDSILSVHLTINSAAATLSQTACITYTSPSGKYIWTQSGQYKDTLVRTGQCDSILTINLTVLSLFFQTQRVSACDIYHSPGGKTFTSSAIFLDTLISQNGCDSILQIILTLGKSAAHQISVSACGTYTSPGGKTHNTSGTYIDSLTRNGCDSILTIQLTILQPSAHYYHVKACNQYQSPGGKIFTLSGIYNDTIPNAAGCDSVLNIQLEIGTPYEINTTDTACNQYTSPTGKTRTTSGEVRDTLVSIHGCDSVMVTQVTIQQVNEQVLKNGFELISQDTLGAYQWMQCENMAEISGAQSKSYKAIANGRYAVKISRPGCSLITPCIEVGGVFVAETPQWPFRVFPNPADRSIRVMFEGQQASLKIYDLSGKKGMDREITSGEEIDISDLPSGAWVLELNLNEQHYRVKLLKH
jgi:hypothetical protein